jgi:hypothetical protein
MSGRATPRLADGSPGEVIGDFTEGAAYLRDYAHMALVEPKAAPRLSVMLATDDVIDVQVVFDAELRVRLVVACAHMGSPLHGQLQSLLQARRPLCTELGDGRVSFRAEYQKNTQVGELVERLLGHTVLKSLTYTFTPMTVVKNGDKPVEDSEPEFAVGFSPKPLTGSDDMFLPEWGWPRVDGVLTPMSPVPKAGSGA